MRISWPFLIILGICSALAGAGAFSAARVKLAPTPVAPPQIAPKPRAPYDPNLVHQTLEFWAKQAKSDPQGAIAQSSLAHWYLESYRETGDIADAIRAEQAARKSLALRTRNNDTALSQLSRSLVVQHRFPEALVIARRAALYNPEAYRQCADIEIEVGDYKGAGRDLARSRSSNGDPAYLALTARLCEIRGENAQALDLLQKAAKLADANPDMPAQSVAWFHERLGHILFQTGRLNEAEQSYRAGLQVFPRDYRTMAALARLNAARNNWAQSIEWAKRATEIVPAPEIIALSGDAYTALGKTQEAQRQYRLVEQMAALSKAQGVTHDRQRALFYADHNRNLPEALASARGELKLRKDIYTYDTLAWVLYKNGKLAEAQTFSNKALAHGTQDASLWYHAGVIANALSQRERARNAFKRALAINPNFHPTAPRQVRALLARLDSASP